MKRPEEEAQALIADVVARMMAHQGAILSLQRVAAVGMTPAASVEMMHEDIAFLRKALQEMLIDKAQIVSQAEVAMYASAMAQQTARSAAEVVDTASLVFGHAVVDDVALTCCKITMLLALEAWGELLGKRQVALAEVRESSYAGLLNKAMARRLEELERASLVDKLDVIFARCRPSLAGPPFTDDTKYDRDRVERLDRARHRVIHEPVLRVGLSNFADDFWYLMRLPFLMIALLHNRFGVGIVPEDIMKAMRSRSV